MRMKLGMMSLCAMFVLVCAQDGREVAADLRAKDPKVRLQALKEIAQLAPDKAEKALVHALSDDDWEVSLAAAETLADHASSKAAFTGLVELALEAPCRKISTAAARALAKVDGAGAAEELEKSLAGKSAERALFALRALYQALDRPPAASSRLVRMATENESEHHQLALETLAASMRAADIQAYGELLRAGSRSDHALVLEATVPASDCELARAAWVTLAGESNAIVERRLLRLVAAAVRSGGSGSDAEGRLRAFREKIGATAVTPGRWARLARELAKASGIAKDVLREIVQLDLARTESDARAAAAASLGTLGEESDAEALATLVSKDADAEVRRRALRALGDLDAALAPAWQAAAIAALASDPDARTRETAAVALGAPAHVEASAALVRALADPDWGVAVCAAVSLGKTGSPEAREALELLLTHADWRMRGAAVIALGFVRSLQSVPALIERIEDAEPAVSRSAFEILAGLAGRRDIERKIPPWKQWWSENHTRLQWKPDVDLAARYERYGYAVPLKEIYVGLDVVVLESRGDHIEEVLKDLTIEYRKTAGAGVHAAELHPAALFFANCTGEIEEGDVERLAWFVRTGGALFSSCWALSETVERIYPGVVRKLPTQAEVLDDVPAHAAGTSSPFLEGVFPPGVEPVYHLEGAHLIEVLEPEWAEVLIDSPECLERHGGGELAAWFPAGHGMILDSVNHFDLQGLETAAQLETAEERQAWAIDHMALEWERWRATRKEKFWGNALRASEAIHDLSTFRFVTNFVRQRRIAAR
jgi:HEAT repeat protein